VIKRAASIPLMPCSKAAGCPLSGMAAGCCGRVLSVAGNPECRRRLLEMGIGAFVEKPLALSGDDARELARLAAERGLPLGVNHNNLHHPAFLRLIERVNQGDIGRVEHVQVTLSVPLAQLDAGDFAHWMFRALLVCRSNN